MHHAQENERLYHGLRRSEEMLCFRLLHGERQGRRPRVHTGKERLPESGPCRRRGMRGLLMRVLFIHSSTESLGLEYLSSSLKKRGHTTALLFEPFLFRSFRLDSRALDRSEERR